MPGYRELNIWQESKKLAVTIYMITQEGIFSKDYGLRDQIRRAAVSVPSNIAEGDERAVLISDYCRMIADFCFSPNPAPMTQHYVPPITWHLILSPITWHTVPLY